MLIIKTPFRVSLFGGGTDVPTFFRMEGGQVLGLTIKKYSYVTVRELPPFYDHNIRLSYSKIERCKTFEEINHPLIRAALSDFKFKNIEIHHDSDLPGRSGIGSSSTFAVGLANGLFSYKGDNVDSRTLADKAIYWERNYLKEKGGYQDQILAAFGGLNHIKFNIDGNYSVNKVLLKDKFKERLNQNALLCYVPNKRLSYLNSVENFLDEKCTIKSLIRIKNTVNNSIELIKSSDIDGLGKLLHESWTYKRSLPKVSNKTIDDIYEKAIRNGALGGKLLGAGKGGFMLFICREGLRDCLAKSLYPLITFPLEMENDGSKLIYLNDMNLQK